MNDNPKRRLSVMWLLLIAISLALSGAALIVSRTSHRQEIDQLESRFEDLEAKYKELSEKLPK